MSMLDTLAPRVHRVQARTVSFEPVGKPLPRPVEILPRDARQLLITASQHMPRSSRVTAINVAITRVRAMYPQFFQKEI